MTARIHKMSRLAACVVSTAVMLSSTGALSMGGAGGQGVGPVRATVT
jgi:hypothetical protein